ncbi:hypothetical protein [Amycolatopsis thermophila]|uniref:Uncharacterized protein n=1 Tax=Amycolatopsis thermophila TaxID=206084 RepID=A0ABU0EML8_9PSEU|nr:hypothetical protein [Amycolatopsis thermophila]MDQ0376534.1 hypothetical protein [Amycolatopsis thermophila]
MHIDWKRLAWIALLIGLVLYVISHPQRSADLVGDAVSWLRQAAEAVITFITSVFNRIV